MENSWNKVGKQMPYSVPEGFFEQQQAELIRQTVGTNTHHTRWWIGGAAAAACLVVGLVGLHSADEPTLALYEYTEQMSEEELSSWSEFYEADLFLSDATFNTYNQ